MKKLLVLYYGILALVAGFAAQPSIAQGSPFQIEVRFLNDGAGFSEKQKQLILEGAARVSKMMTAPLVPVNADIKAGSCDKDYPAIKETVRGMIVFVQAKNLGAGSYAQAGPCDLRPSYLPIYGGVAFNTIGLAELSDVDTLYTMMHEVIHVLGGGTLWEASSRTLPDGTSDGKNLISSAGYTAAGALKEYKNLGGAGEAIPLDPDKGHWLGSVFCTEIISGSPDAGVANPVSRVTLASLADLGYSVNLEAADPYKLCKTTALTGSSNAALAGISKIQFENGTMHVYDSNGRHTHRRLEKSRMLQSIKP